MSAPAFRPPYQPDDAAFGVGDDDSGYSLFFVPGLGADGKGLVDVTNRNTGIVVAGVPAELIHALQTMIASHEENHAEQEAVDIREARRR